MIEIGRSYFPARNAKLSFLDQGWILPSRANWSFRNEGGATWLPLQCSIDSDAPARGAQRIRVMSQRLSHWVSDRYFPSPTSALHRLVTGGAIVTATLIASAIFNRVAVKRAERDNPAVGKFVDVGALRLHYVERG